MAGSIDCNMPYAPSPSSLSLIPLPHSSPSFLSLIPITLGLPSPQKHNSAREVFLTTAEHWESVDSMFLKAYVCRPQVTDCLTDGGRNGGWEGGRKGGGARK